MNALGARTPGGVTFDFSVKTHWQPVESQRAQLYASRYGKGEVFMDALGGMHFERAKSASERGTLLDACEAVGMDRDAMDAWLDGDELGDEVWASYGDAIRELGIHSIPLFIFSLEKDGGPFRQRVGKSFTHNGSGSAAAFEALFEEAYEASGLKR